ncbi:hypothetical protein QT979_18535 [Microcoleus sp. w2-18bC1]|uniref:hypothetical protein n=1 Tax=unclassified Microcoleus TaxID=2642155 RepID=UPI002FD77BC1
MQPLNISAAVAASQILAKKFCARAYNPSQQGFSLLQLAKAKSLLAVVSWNSLKINNSQLTTHK